MCVCVYIYIFSYLDWLSRDLVCPDPVPLFITPIYLCGLSRKPT